MIVRFKQSKNLFVVYYNTQREYYDPKVVIPERLNNYNVVEIGLRAFENNTEIENVILPTTLESIGSFSFFLRSMN